MAILPLPNKSEKINISPTQVVFRFDEHRYVQLTGSNCVGKLYYIDEQKQIYHELSVHSAKVITEPFAHTVGDYIFVPYTDYSGVRYSQDGGRTFKIIYIGNPSTRPDREEVKNIVVVNNQFFMDSAKGLYRSSEAYGTHHGVEILSTKEDYFLGSIRYGGIRWGNLSQIMPTLPSDYTGWHQWQCDFNLEQQAIVYSRFESLIELQSTLRQLLGISKQEEK
ncbi:hypothetical protein RCS94_07050 [Orbaceae bacterium ac157xtp]